MAVIDRVKKAFGGKDGEEARNDQIIEETGKIWEYLKQSRRRSEYEWFINDVYYNNNQYLKYNTGNRRLQSTSVEKANDRVIINKVKVQVRGIVNFLNAEHPSIGFRPGNQSDNAYLRAKKQKRLAEFWYRSLKMNATFKNISLDAAKYGIGWAKTIYDQDALSPTEPFTGTDGKEKNYTYGEVMVARCDPFEIYFDPMAQAVQDQRYMAHAPVRTIAELKANPLYKNTDKLASDNKLAASLMKQSELRLATSNANNSSASQPNNMDTTVVLEIFRKLFNKESNKWEIWVTTRTEAGVLLRHEVWKTNRYPFDAFKTDIAGMLIESKGVIHDIREPNRALNEMVSQVHESARIMGKLNWLMPRGSNVNVITDQTGQFIEYDITPGGAPRQAEAISLPTYIMQHIGQLDAFIEDISGMHASFNGRAPFAQASGDLVNELSAGDQNNLTMMRDNYDDFAVNVFESAFATAKSSYQTTRKFPTDQEDEFGEVDWETIKPDEICLDDNVSVSTGTQMPYSIADKQQMYMNLWKEKAIVDPTVLFKLLEMPDIDAAMGNDEPDIERQLNELRDCMKGKTPPDPEIFENHSVHIATIDKFGRGNNWLDLADASKQLVRDHRQKHVELSIQLAQIQASLQMEPIKRSETVMLRMNKMSDTTAIERTQLLSKFGVNSDAAQIQLRGGLYIQDPAQAEMQAMNEDTEMMDMRAVQVSFGDNHLVHLQTHGPVMDLLVQAQKDQNTPSADGKPKKKIAQPISDVVLKLFKQHIKDHTLAMEAIQVAPGLVPNDQISMPNQANLNDTGPVGQMPQEDTNISRAAGERQAKRVVTQPITKPAPDTVAPGTPPGPNPQSNPLAPKRKVVQNKSKSVQKLTKRRSKK